MISENTITHMCPMLHTRDIAQLRKTCTELQEFIDTNQEYMYEHCGHTQPHGKIIERYENGQKRKETVYKDGNRVGIYTGWYENSQKEYTGFYNNEGGRDGVGLGWYESGQKRIEEFYKDGKRDGLLTVWYESGRKRLEHSYKDGEQDGVWTGWEIDGATCYRKEGRTAIPLH